MILKHFEREGYMLDMIGTDPALACHSREYKKGYEEMMKIASE